MSASTPACRRRSPTPCTRPSTEWTDTDFGPAKTKAYVTYYSVLLEGETAVDWPLFQRDYGFRYEGDISGQDSAYASSPACA
jgi:hypothetical protein